MRLFLQDGPARLQILSPSHLREFRDVGAAREFLRPLLAHAGNAHAVRNALGFAPQADDLVEHLANRMVHEGLQVISCADSYLASILGTFTEASSAASTPSAQTTTPLQDEEAAQQQPAPASEENHFIEIELVDEEGKPMADQSYLIELPDGTQRTGRTDVNGKARIEGIDPGTAKVSFPEYDKAVYEKN
ncbi:MAG TPA: carboxypeptidase-like regulatory domain-containing protein [Thermoanaerobaculia bacterium]|nr:carboxypeptidase-like regulatory domain-containing protein [Thermoanaerobaculia bacterium]